MMTEPTDVVAYLVDGGWECATCAAKSEADGALVYGVTRAEMEALDTQGRETATHRASWAAGSAMRTSGRK